MPYALARHNGQAMRFTSAIVSSHTGHPTLNTSTLRFALMVEPPLGALKRYGTCREPARARPGERRRGGEHSRWFQKLWFLFFDSEFEKRTLEDGRSMLTTDRRSIRSCWRRGPTGSGSVRSCRFSHRWQWHVRRGRPAICGRRAKRRSGRRHRRVQRRTGGAAATASMARRNTVASGRALRCHAGRSKRRFVPWYGGAVNLQD